MLASLAKSALTAFAAEGCTDTPMPPDGEWRVHNPALPKPRVATQGATLSHGVPAPSDAMELFDGTNFAKWQCQHGDEVKWKLESGQMEATKN